MKRLLALLALPALAFAGDAERGREVVLAKRDGSCLLCHVIPGAERPSGNIGPSLAGVGSRLSLQEIRLRLTDASRIKPDTVMPSYGRIEGLHGVAPEYRGKPLLTPQEIEDAAAFLATLK